MRVSLPGLLKNAEQALRSSRDSHACMLAYVLLEMGDNLRVLAAGKCTVEEFFATYPIGQDDQDKLADLVRKENYACMNTLDTQDDED